MEDLWMKALRHLKPEVLPDGGRRLWWLLVLVNQTYLYISHYIIHNIHESELYIRWMQRMFSRRNWVKSACRAISRLWGILGRDSCMQTRRRQLGGEPPVHSRSVVKISYNIKMTTKRSDLMMTEEVPYGYVPVLQLYSIVQIYMKPSQCSRL